MVNFTCEQVKNTSISSKALHIDRSCSIVTKDIPANTVAVRNPCKVLGKIEWLDILLIF